MNSRDKLQQRPGVMRAAMALLLVGMLCLMSASGVAARQTGSTPTVGALFVTDYDCDTGLLSFRAPVTNLPNVPAGTAASDFPLAYSFTARYKLGPDISSAQPSVLSPTSAEAPYTGNVFLALTVPPTNAQGQATSILIRVSVAPGGAGMGAIDNPTSISQLTFLVSCDDDDLVGQLVEVLKRILLDALAVG
jgi:hypothetical protein